MNVLNNATLIRRELMIRLARLVLQDKVKDIDRIPVEMFPRRGKSVRCCIYKDRAMTKYRLMALMGHRMEEEQDELTPLCEYAEQAEQRQDIEAPILTVLDEACSACVRSNYYVTDACRGCVARPCMTSCKKNAIKMQDGRAVIDPDLCVNCGLCQKECPYHAIIYMPVPCEEACPVGAISKDEDGKEQIDYDKCTFCGKCMRACPFGAIMERSQMIDVLKRLKQKKPMTAMVAPAIIGQFSAELGQMVTALRELGFDHVIEVAYGADMTAAHESEEFSERMQNGAHFMTTSCCPAFTETVNKHLPELEPFISDTPTPMHYTAEKAREHWPDSQTIFIGPCVAKRHEALDDEQVDLVLSIEELGSMFVAADIDVQQCEPSALEMPAHAEGRGFAALGGVSRAIEHAVNGPAVKSGQVDGLDKKQVRALKRYPDSCDCNFLEVMACEGGCIAGPAVINNPKLAKRSLEKFLNQTV
ncbi:MAG: 4Fe-4S dicluster domain-containing protein [candidate division KSB1 bacterium]|nr:4Fe-4S dicluster domain-containing protein [candidate division KSB1 bacterium]